MEKTCHFWKQNLLTPSSIGLRLKLQKILAGIQGKSTIFEKNQRDFHRLKFPFFRSKTGNSTF